MNRSMKTAFLQLRKCEKDFVVKLVGSQMQGLINQQSTEYSCYKIDVSLVDPGNLYVKQSCNVIKDIRTDQQVSGLMFW